jgi:hypothetical protein
MNPVSTQGKRAAAPGRPKQGPVHGLTEIARFGPFVSPQGLTEPRASALSEGRSTYSAIGEWS